jgi:hypothetical protein
VTFRQHLPESRTQVSDNAAAGVPRLAISLCFDLAR